LTEATLSEPPVQAPHQDGALNQEASDDNDDDTILHQIPHTANPNFTDAFTGATANPSQDAGGIIGGFEGPCLEGVQVDAQTTLRSINTITTDVPSQSSHQAPLLPQASQHPREPRQSAEEFNAQQVYDDEFVTAVELAQLRQETEWLQQEQENIARRRVVSQHAQTIRQQVEQERARLAELQQAINILR
jgi:hypothetical protein